MKIMAPAGDADRLLAALNAGADEIYMGIAGFGARRFAKNFQVDEFCRAIDLAHRHHVTLHLTLNTILSDTELDAVLPDVRQLAAAGLDAVIVQDFGVARRLREVFPTLPLCASTQMSCSRPAEALFLQEHGFSRIVLARELDFAEIEAIRQATSLELEVFASGALCLGTSGKCFLSSFIGGRSGNRGMCAQPCRHCYMTDESTTAGTRSHDTLNTTGYHLSLADQWQERSELERLKKMGIDSIKIEGRMKSPVYVYEAVRFYRGLLDSIQTQKSSDGSGRVTPTQANTARIRRTVKDLPSDDHSPTAIASLFNRGYAKGYLYEHDPQIINRLYSSNFGVELGRVEGNWIRLSQNVRLGDGIVYLDNRFTKLGGTNVNQLDRLDERSRRRCRATEAGKGELVCFETAPPPEATLVYKTCDHALNRELTHRIEETRRYTPIALQLTAKVGKPLVLTLTLDSITIQKNGNSPLEAARKTPVPDNPVSRSLAEAVDRFGDSPFYPATCEIDADENVFVPKSMLNQIRQEATTELENTVLESRRRPELIDINLNRINLASANKMQSVTNRTLEFSACVRTPEQRQVCETFGIKRIYSPVTPLAVNRPLQKPETNPLAGTLDDALRFESQNQPYTSDWTFNVGNSCTVDFLLENLTHLTTLYLSPELSGPALAELIAKVRRWASREIRLALPVYGHLTAMFTRKTLFDRDEVQLQDELGHHLVVAKNCTWYPNGEAMTGSSLFLSKPLDILSALPRLREWGLDEARFDFTFEDAAEVQSVLERANRPTREIVPRFSYGFEHGIF